MTQYDNSLRLVSMMPQKRVAQSSDKPNQEKLIRNKLEQAALNLKSEADYNSDSNKKIREEISSMGKEIVPLLEKMKTEGISRSAFETYILNTAHSSVDSGIKAAIFEEKNKQFQKFIDEILNKINSKA